jgi:hypothetical protein
MAVGTAMDCMMPTYDQLTINPLAVPGGPNFDPFNPTGYEQVNIKPGTYVVVNGYLYQATQPTTLANTGRFFGPQPAGFAAAQAKGSTFTDGGVIWTCRGKACLVRVHFANVSGSAATPVAQQYDLFQL